MSTRSNLGAVYYSVRCARLTMPASPSDVDFKDARGRKYKWRGNVPGLRLEVCTSYFASHLAAT